MTRWLANVLEQQPLIAVASVVASILLSIVAIVVVLTAPDESATARSPRTITAVETVTSTVERTTTVTNTRTVAAPAPSQTVFALPLRTEARGPVQLSWVALRSGLASEEVEVRRRRRVVASFETEPSRVVAGRIYEVAWAGAATRAGTFEFCVRSSVAGARGAWSCASVVLAR